MTLLTGLVYDSEIAPHGGVLCERMATGEEAAALAAEAHHLPQLAVDRRTLADIRLFGMGVLSPLKGFMVRREYEHVIETMRLPNGLVWTIPITLPADEPTVRDISGERLALTFQNRPVAVMTVAEIFQPDRRREALSVYGVDDEKHPGVDALYRQGAYAIGGDITVIDLALDEEGALASYCLSPRQLRRLFAQKNWRTVVAFQTRNPIHRAHEYLQKCALEMVDGLLIHPLIGATKADDIDARTRFACYETMLKHYFPPERVVLAAFPASMRYAGPKEAIFHALCRKNYGCTHFIVGRDHAGVGSFYGTYDAQRIFDQFRPEQIGIEPLRFEHAFYCRPCQGMATTKSCPHAEDERVFLSGTKVRRMIREGVAPPPEFTRPEVARILIEAAGGQRE